MDNFIAKHSKSGCCARYFWFESFQVREFFLNFFFGLMLSCMRERERAKNARHTRLYLLHGWKCIVDKLKYSRIDLWAERMWGSKGNRPARLCPRNLGNDCFPAGPATTSRKRSLSVVTTALCAGKFYAPVIITVVSVMITWMWQNCDEVINSLINAEVDTPAGHSWRCWFFFSLSS